MVNTIFQSKLLIGIISYVVFIISASTHEYSHARASYELGDKTARDLGRLTLNPLAHIDIFGTVILPIIAIFTGIPLIGFMKAVPVNSYNLKNRERDQAIIAFAGPFSNLIIAIIAFIIIKVATLKIDGTFLIYKFIILLQENNNIITSILLNFIPVLLSFLIMFYIINIMLMFFNLLPFTPLDGGWILRFLLSDSKRVIYDKIYPYGFLILYALLFAGILGTIFDFIYSIANSFLGDSFKVILSL